MLLSMTLCPDVLVPRFWSKVDRRGPGECWPWTACKKRDGYGIIGHFATGKTYLAHRLAFLLHRGRWPKACCLHRCDNRGCVNPEHLFEGTRSDNSADMKRKGRSAKGSRSPGAKLTEERVQEIRALRGAGLLCREIAAEYGVATSTIVGVTSGRTWTHV